MIIRAMKQPYLPAALFMLPLLVSIAFPRSSLGSFLTLAALLTLMLAVYFNRNYALAACTVGILALGTSGYVVLMSGLTIWAEFSPPDPITDIELWKMQLQRINYLPLIIPAIVVAVSVPTIKRGGRKLRLVDWRQPASRSDTNALGSARFANAADIEPLICDEGAILGKTDEGDLVRAAQDNGEPLEGHLTTWAKTRGGKGVSATIPNLLLLNHPVIINCPKGETIIVTGRARQDKGYHPYRIDPFGVADRWTTIPTSTYNPLRWVKSDRNFTRRIQGIRDALILSKDGDQAHFNELAEVILDGLIAWVCATAPGRDRHLGTVYDMMMAPDDEQQLEVFRTLVADPKLGDGLPYQAGAFVLGLKSEELSGAFSTTRRHLVFLQDPNWRRVLCVANQQNELDFHAVFEDRADIFLTVPFDVAKRQPRLGRLIFGQATAELMVYCSEKGTLPVRVYSVIDEFLQLGKMSIITDNWNSIAGYGMSYWLFIHNMGKLEEIYGKEAQTFFTSDVMQVLTLARSDQRTPELLEKLLGKYTVKTQGTQVNTGRQGQSSTPIGGRNSAGESVSESEQGRSLLNATEILEMPENKQLILYTSKPPILINRVKYYKDAEFVGLFDQNPLAERN